jgi:predicted lipoprotein
VKGSGEVLEVNEEGARVRISPGAHEAEALLHTGLLFGNALRDGSGLIDPGQFPNSQHFNDIATELNRLAETNVLPLLRKIAVPGKKLSFIGCAELEEDETPHPLKIVPVRVE